MNKLLYIADTESSVFESQVAGLLNALSEKGMEVTLLLGSKVGAKARLGTLNAAVKVVEFRLYPSEVVFIPLQLLAIRAALATVGSVDDVTIHVRSEKYGMYLKLLQVLMRRIKWPVLVDVRGAVKEESMEFKNFGFLRKQTKNLYFEVLRRVLQRSRFTFSTVSQELLAYTQRRYELHPTQIIVTPCTAVATFKFDASRRGKVREMLGFGSQDIVILFSSSGNAQWQAVDRLAEFAAKNSGFRLINLSRHAIRHPNVLNMFVPLEEVPCYIDAADFGLILRDPSIVNNVACPVKFVEYAASGLPILSDGNVEVVSEHIKATQTGQLLDYDGTLAVSKLVALPDDKRQFLSDQACSRYEVYSVSERYQNIYSEMQSAAVR